MNYKKDITAWKNEDMFTRTVTFHFNGSDHAKIARHFANNANVQAFGNAAERFGKTLTFFAVRQKDPDHTGYHVHFAIGGFPEWCNPQVVLENAAKKTRGIWGVDIGPITDDKDWLGKTGQEGWLNYMTRQLEVNDDVLL